MEIPKKLQEMTKPKKKLQNKKIPKIELRSSLYNQD